MFKAYVSQVKTLKTTGDVTGAIEITCAEDKGLKQQVMDVDHETVVVMTMKEFDSYLKVIREFGIETEGMKEEVEVKDNLELEEKE
jgi:hypothetical protein